MMSTIINFFGGPGIGKSTQAAGLFTEMKKCGIDVELTYEFPKEVTWEGNFSAIKDQFYITANQHRNISRLYGKVEFIIVDSPIVLGSIYRDKYSNNEYPSIFYEQDSFDKFIWQLFKSYKNINIVLKRDDSTYNENGRFQNLMESKEIDEEIKTSLVNNNVSFVEFDVNTNTYLEIFKYIKDITP
jgi:hypothetical protein